jgi:hypothetical protein
VTDKLVNSHPISQAKKLIYEAKQKIGTASKLQKENWGIDH